ncbi:DUF3084 domain-containing protein [Pyramidobacter sp. YE332]|uniref:DUF3084 domain-containing protein n=1 Tax=Pyramidobacter sp. YE332 TaxID=3068894 RepID=UPI00294B316B|nr:DUF3084 domain-containing protein [Pyramidobacter sp. YE332]WOL40850.1 DUF3084 domain-containing protein [Pyramidobacter sp. YE332]
MEESLWELLTEVNWKMIALTLLAGGVLSIIGDRVGMKFAKRRVTLFNLRPKYTSSILTACTGMLISLCVIAILAVVSESVRTSLFSMQFIQRQIVDLTRQLQDSRNEQQISSLLIVEAQQQLTSKEKELDDLQTRADALRKTTEEMQAERDRLTQERARLEEDVNRIRTTLGKLQEGRIVAFSDERLGQEVIPEGVASEAEARRYLDRLNERVRFEVARRSDAVPASISLEEDPESLQNAMQRILAYDSRKVVRAMVPQNIAAGETVRVVYRVYESSLVFRKEEALITRVLRFKPSAEQAETMLSYMLRELNRMATSSGILNDPLTGMVGGIPANDFYDGVERLAAAKAPLRVTLLAARDIYSEGPVSVKIVVEQNVSLDNLDSLDEELPDLTAAERGNSSVLAKTTGRK